RPRGDSLGGGASRPEATASAPAAGTTGVQVWCARPRGRPNTPVRSVVQVCQLEVQAGPERDVRPVLDLLLAQPLVPDERRACGVDVVHGGAPLSCRPDDGVLPRCRPAVCSGPPDDGWW